MASTLQRSGLSLGALLGRTSRQFLDDRVLGKSAELAFYTVLSLFPLLLFLVSLLGLLLQSESLPQTLLERYLAAVSPDAATPVIHKTLKQISGGFNPLTLTFAVLFLWWSATKGMLSAIAALNVANDVRDPRPFWRRFVVASLLTFALLLIATVTLAMLLWARRAIAGVAGADAGAEWITIAWQVGRWLFVLLMVLLSFNLVYRFAPRVQRSRWEWLMPGTIVGVALWLFASIGFQVYLRQVGWIGSAYGSIGAVITLLLWLYASSIAFLIGAEVNAEIERAASSARD